MELFKNKYDFVRDELKDLPQFSELPKGKLKDFTKSSTSSTSGHPLDPSCKKLGQ